MDDNETCPICLEGLDDGKDVQRTECNHVFHSTCWQQLVETNRPLFRHRQSHRQRQITCPCCRNQIVVPMTISMTMDDPMSLSRRINHGGLSFQYLYRRSEQYGNARSQEAEDNNEEKDAQDPIYLTVAELWGYERDPNFWEPPRWIPHRDEDLPAMIETDGTQHWYQHGKHHRPSALGPAIIRSRGRKEWWMNGLYHRDATLDAHDPAIVNPNGRHEWWQHGRRHRQAYIDANGAVQNEGPAYVSPDGTQYWFQQGKLHRTVPVPIDQLIHVPMQPHQEQHRDLDPIVRRLLPAVMYPDGCQEWYRYNNLIRTNYVLYNGMRIKQT